MKLTPKLLKQIIEEEVAKFGKMTDTEDAADDAEEVDADEYAGALEKKIDYAKALKIEEARLEARLKIVREAREKLAKKILAGI